MVIMAELLSRIQFGFTIGFHILFPTINIGLAVFLCVVEGLFLKTKDKHYYSIYQFWTKIFALTFGMGVVSGIVLSYELGTNFGMLTKNFGAIIGPLFGYEVLSAFFLEAGFLGIMVFGWKRVSHKVHFFATFMVALGTLISAFWIMSANSWMQTPAGFEFLNGEYIVKSWMEVVFNPSFLPRFFHMVNASLITCAFIISGVTGWYLRQNRHLKLSKLCFKLALGAILILVPLQILVGDLVGLKINHYQPLKTAAMEGAWKTQNGAPLVLFAFPDTKTHTNRYSIEIPYLASLINTHQLKGKLIGLDSAEKKDWPLVKTVFFNFRIMVSLGFLMLFVAIWGAWLWKKNRLFTSRAFLKICLWLGPLGLVSTISGWMVAETGRQPWTIYGLQRTSHAATAIDTLHVSISLAVFTVVYIIIFTFYLYYLIRVIHKGPDETSEPPFMGYMTHIQENR